MLRRCMIFFASLALLFLSATSCEQPASDGGAANKDLVRQLFAAIDANDFERLRELAADDFVLHYVGVPDSMDLDATEEIIRNFYTAFPDYTHQIIEMIAEGDRVAVRVTYRATHEGDFEGIAPTGNAVTYTGVQILTVEGGKIRRSWVLEDNLGLMTQLGMALAPAPASQ